MGGPPPVFLSPYRPIQRDRIAAEFRNRLRGSVSHPGQHAETSIHWRPIKIAQEPTAAVLRNRLRGRAWIPGGQQVHQPETPISYPQSVLRVIGQHPWRAGKASPPRVHLPETPVTFPGDLIVRGRQYRRQGDVWIPLSPGPSVYVPPTAIHQWTVLAGQHPWRAGRAAVPKQHLPETPITYPWSALRSVGQHPWRAGRAAPPRVHLPETPVGRGWSVQQVIGRHPWRAGKASPPTVHPPETPVLRPWAVQQIIGRRWRQRGILWLPVHVGPFIPPPTLTPLNWKPAKRSPWPPYRGHVWIEPLPYLPPAVPSKTPLRGMMVRRTGEAQARRPKGWILRWAPAPIVGGSLTIGYNIYANTGAGDPINYLVPIATVYGLTYTTSPLSYPGDWKIAVRAFNVYGEEKNLDCEVELILDSSGNDITNRPTAPTALRAFATVGGGIRVEWAYPPPLNPAKTPTGFHVYDGIGSVNYISPVATVSWGSGIVNMFVANLSGLTGGTTYQIGVRAYNGTAEEPNTNFVTVTADTTGPGPVDSLTGSPTVGG
jgi:hypothetical protein